MTIHKPSKTQQMKKGDKIKIVSTDPVPTQHPTFLSQFVVGDVRTVAHQQGAWVGVVGGESQLHISQVEQIFYPNDPEIWIEPKIIVDGAVETWTPQHKCAPQMWGVYYNNKRGEVMHTGFDLKTAEEAQELTDLLINLVNEIQ